MSDETSGAGGSETPEEQHNDRIFLVVVDETEEMRVALRFACRRARNTGGRVALFYVIEPSDFQHWQAVGDLMREEARSEGERLMQKLAAEVNDLSGKIPILFVREGKVRDELLKLLDEEPGISILVLGASVESRGPGPLVAALTGKLIGKLRVPMTIVPGSLSDDMVDAIG